MQKEVVMLLKHLLDNCDPNWAQNEEIYDAFSKLKVDKKNFEPPTLDEVIIELKRQKVRYYTQQAEKFWNFYESKNWMIGKNKMKNWKAAIKTWNFDKDNIIL